MYLVIAIGLRRFVYTEMGHQFAFLICKIERLLDYKVSNMFTRRCILARPQPLYKVAGDLNVAPPWVPALAAQVILGLSFRRMLPERV